MIPVVSGLIWNSDFDCSRYHLLSLVMVLRMEIIALGLVLIFQMANFGVSNDYAHTGRYSSRITINSDLSGSTLGAYSYQFFSAAERMYSRQYVYFTVCNLSNGHRGDIGQFRSASNNLDLVWVCFLNNNGTFVWALNDGTYVSNTQIPLNQWISVEVMYGLGTMKHRFGSMAIL